MTTSRRLENAYEALVRIGEYEPLVERQYDIWHRLVIAGPTRSDAGVQSNDFPGLYVYEPRSRLSHFLVFGGEIDWGATECGLVTRDGATYAGFSTRRSGGLNGTLHHYTKRETAPPDRWRALRELVTFACDRLLSTPRSALKMADFSALATQALRTIADDDEAINLTVSDVRGLRMYVAGSSQAWNDKTVDHLELMAHTGLLWALVAAEDELLDPTAQLVCDRLIELVPRFFQPDLGVFVNSFPFNGDHLQGGNTAAARVEGRPMSNVWYHLYNHVRLLEVVLRRPSIPWRDDLMIAVERTLAIAKTHDALLPLFWWLDDGSPCGGLHDYGAAGLLSWLSLRAYQATRSEAHLRLAEHALHTLHRLPFEHLYGEALMLPRAAASAHHLLELTGDTQWQALREDFTAASLRQMYWYGDGTGSFNAVAGMCYPAFMENVQTLVAFEQFRADSSFPLTDIALRQLAHDSAFFEESRAHSAVPIENLSTLEYPFGGLAGQEIYGIGEVFWLARLQRSVVDHDDS